MKRFVIFVFLAMFLAACSTNTMPANSMPAQQATSQVVDGNSASVSIKGFAFNPSELTVKKGTTVTWTNMDSAPHTVTSDSGNELSSQVLNTGNSYSHTFDTVGTFEYHCSIHTSMKAKVIVE